MSNLFPELETIGNEEKKQPTNQLGSSLFPELDDNQSQPKANSLFPELNQTETQTKQPDTPGILDYAKSLIRQPLPGPAGLMENILNPNQPKIPLSVDSVKRGIDTAKDAVNSTYEALASGSAQGAAALARTPNLIYNVAALPINQALKASGYQEIKDPAIFEDSAKWWDSLSNETDVKSKKWAEQGQDINTFVRDGNYKEAGKWLAYQTIKNLPQQVMFVGSAMAGVPAAGLALAGTSSAAQELAEGRERGASPTSSVLNATMNGMIEASFENLGTFGLFKETAKTFGKASTNVFKETIKTLFKEPLGEGAEEFATSLAQDFSRYVNGIDPNAMKGSVGRALAAGSIGTASGAAVTTPAAIRMGLNQRGKINDFSTENDVPRGTIIDGKTMGPKTENYLSKQYPQLYEGILNKEIPLEPDQVNDLLFKSAAAGEEVLLKGGTPEQANQAATEAFVREATPLVNQVEQQRAINQPLPQVGSSQPFDLENDAIEPAQVDDSVISFPEPSKNIRIPKKQIMAEAQNLYDRAIEDREGSVSALERFVKDNGGIAPYSINPTTGQKEEREEYRAIPVRLRGNVPYDEMMQMAIDNNILPPDSAYGDLYEQLGSIKKRGDLPRLEDFYDEARRNIEYEKLQARVNKGEKLPPDIAANYSAMRRNDLLIKAREAAYKVLSANKIDDRVIVNIVDQIAVDPIAFKEGYGTEYKQDTFDILGATYPAQAKSRIQAVIELAQGATELTGRHEAFHAVSNILLEENEQSIITKKYGDMEKAADAFGEYRATKASTGDSVIDRVFQRITEFLEKFSNYLTENNFTTADELFKKIEGGKFADRVAKPKGTTQYSVIQLDMYDGKKARVVKNPTPEQARNLSLQSPYGSLRYLQSPDGHLYVWDAEKLTHNDVMNELGVEATPQNLEKTGTVGNEVEAAQIAKQFSDGAASPRLKGTTQYSAAYHGSPHVFDKFSLQKIGTGEGEQAYGYGLYFSGKKEVAEYYKDKLSGTKFVEKSTGKVFDSREIPSNKLNRLATDFKQFKGRLYKVDIPDDAEYLDWDKPFSKQSKNVKDALLKINSPEIRKLISNDVEGNFLYRTLVRDQAKTSEYGEGFKNASLKLAELGIPGIKYKDQGSRFNLYVGNNKDNTAFEVRDERNNVIKTFDKLDEANDYVANQGTSNYVVFDDNLVKITDVQYSAKPKEQNAPAFYSQLQNTLEKKLPVRAMPDQIENILNSQDVKKEEVEWSGVKEWLAERKGKGSIPKQEVIDFIKQNNVQIKEVMKGADDNLIVRQSKNPVPNPDWQIYDRQTDRVIGGGFETEAEAMRALPEIARGAGSQRSSTKFDKWQLPGGENYREMLLTLPPDNKRVFPEGSSIKQLSSMEDDFGLVDKNGSVLVRGNSIAGVKTNWEMFGDVRGGDISNKRPDLFLSSHFSEPNILAHIRFNDRVDAEGKKVLFVEEIQSDWHQQGREKGYQTEKPKLYESVKAEEIRLQSGELDWTGFAPDGRYLRVGKGVVLSESEARKYISDYMNENAKRDNHERLDVRQVPNAPFKKTWHELALKKMLRYASENGYEKIAWTTGEQQAERYDLSKQVSSVDYKKNSDGTYRVSAHTRNNEGVMLSEKATEKELPEIIGKDVAHRIVDGKGESVNFSGNNEPPNLWNRLSGVDLKVGGEGMKGFYDQMIPAFLNKYTKKWGGRVESTEIQTPLPDNISHRETNFGHDVVDRDGEYLLEGASDAEYARFIEKRGLKEVMLTVPSLDITPAMRESVLEVGQPQYSARRKQTESPEFKKWFGDSKVVDEKGEPLVVYHGTGESFSNFDESTINKNEKRGDYIGKGFFFHESPESASKYAETYGKKSPSIIPAFLKLEKPLVIFNNKQAQELRDSFGGDEKYFDLTPEEISKEIKRRGYDGLIDKIYHQYAVISPTQIKSATGNTGAFDPTNPDIRYSAKVKPGDSGNIPQDVYAQNRAMKPQSAMKTDLIETKQNLRKALADTFVPISTRLNNIDPSLFKAIRRHEYNLAQQISKDLKILDTFLKKIHKVMTADDLKDFDLARKNGDAEMLQRMIIKYRIGSEYYALRNMFNKTYDRAKEVNFDLGYREHYHPRSLKDKRGFLEHHQKGENWPILSEAIAEKELAIGRKMTMEEQADFLNTMIRGYGRGKISLSETSQMKARRIEFVDAATNQYFYNSDAAAIQYINQVNTAIEARKFFGKHANIAEGNDFGVSSKQLDLNNSIGAYVIDLLNKGKLGPNQEQELTEILRARFAPVQMGPIASLYRDVSYIDTMGSIISAVTQLGDLGHAAYRSNPLNAGKNFLKALVNKSDISMADLGIEQIAEEFTDPRRMQKAIKKIFYLSGLEKMDRLGKETYINSAIDSLRKQARNPDPVFMARLNRVFEEDTQSVISDLKSGTISEDILFLAANQIMDLQPLTKSETPVRYQISGNGRLLYMLKQFQIKQLDYFRTETNLQMADKTKAGKIKGVTNLIYMGMAMMLANAGADFLKNLMLNRPTNPRDLLVDNLFRLALISKYTVYSARSDGLGTAIVKTVAPPAKLLTSVYKDFGNYNFDYDPDKPGDKRFKGNLQTGKPLETTQSIPLVGKLYYWWFGGGVDKTKNTKKRMAKAARKNK